MTAAHIPWSWVAGPAGLPSVCARHGEPAVERRRVKLVSRTPGWSYVLLLAGVLPYFIVTAILRRAVQAPAWPFCVQCRRRRLRLTLGAAGLFVVTVVLLCTTAVLAPSRGGPPALPVVLAFAAFVGGVALATLAGAPAIAGAELSEDGWWVKVKQAHPAFADSQAWTPPGGCPAGRGL